MNILQGRWTRNFEEAAELAFQESGVSDMSTDVAQLFTPIADAHTLGGEAEKSVAATIRNEYKQKPEWNSRWWCIPIPLLRYDARDVPLLAIETKVYLVVVVNVKTIGNFYSVTLVGPLGKTETLVIPMLFLQALLQGDLGRFGVLARSGSHTIWQIPGSKPVQLPSGLISKLSEIFKRESVAMWLGDFGSQGRSVAPLVVGSLLGLQFQDKVQPIPAAEQSWTAEQLIGALEENGLFQSGGHGDA